MVEPRDTTLVRVLRVLLGLGMIAQGINHFVMTDLMVAIMPGYLPWHRALVLVSGVAEVVLGAGVFVPRWRRAAGWGLLLLLVAVFPANVEMVRRASDFPQIPELALWLRLPLQPLFMLWVWVTCMRRATPSRAPAA